MDGDDLAIDVDTRWPGGRQGGYFPIRIQILNKGETRELTLRFDPHQRQRLPSVDMTVEATQNAPETFTLRIPLVGHGSSGKLQVLDEFGDPIEGLEREIRLPNLSRGNEFTELTGILIVGEADVPAQELSVATAAVNRLARAGGYHYGGRSSVADSIDVQRISPARLPELWIDYSTVDFVFIELRELKDLPAAKLRPIVQWVQCGGTLAVYDPGDKSAQRLTTVLNSLLGFEKRGAKGDGWREAPTNENTWDAAENAVARYTTATQRGGRIRHTGGLPKTTGKPQATMTTAPIPNYEWPKTKDAFHRRDLAWGVVVAIPDNPFEGTQYDWAWFFKSMPEQRYQWTRRHGVAPRRDTEEFIDFLIPGVKGVPVYSYLFLITAFTIIIGPLNYFLMWRRKRLFLLVLTIPIIAFVTSLGLFGYSALSQGFEVKSRTRSVTILDQRTNEAVSISRVAMFSGFPPSEGLQFSPNTAVYPIWPIDKHFEVGQVDWTNGQQLKSGWLPSRTRTQFLAITHRRERGRLEISRKSQSQLEVINGFEVDIKGLLVADDNGKLYFTEKLAAGDTASLSPPTGSQLQIFDTLLREPSLEAPDDVTMQRTHRRVFGFRVRSYPGRPMVPSASYSNNLAEQKIAELRKIRATGSGLPNRCYVAILAGPLNLDLGIEDSRRYQGYHVVIGYY